MELTNSLQHAGLSQKLKDAYREGYNRATTKDIAYQLVPSVKLNTLTNSTARQEITSARELTLDYSRLEKIAFAIGV